VVIHHRTPLQYSIPKTVYIIHFKIKTGHTAITGHQSVAFVLSWKFWSTFNAEVKTVIAVAPYN
jgi:hypothetical protein